MILTTTGIKFSRNQSAFRTGLGLVKGDGLIGHHITPWVLQDHDLVQKAAQGGFHIDDAFRNGKAVTGLQQPGSHPNYTNQVKAMFDQFI